MRLMVLVKANDDSEAGIMPGEEVFAAMGKYNEELVNAGVMLAGAVTDGPFAEPKELIAGFWLIQAKSKEEAIEWVKRAPFEGTELEIRQVFEAADFGDELTPELREKDEQLRARLEEQQS
jgi:hypothetical protein